ncbi:MAG: hypothetical protein ABIQ52_19570 [Vicinamibacterales bacterium]
MQTRNVPALSPGPVIAGVLLLLAGTAMYFDAARISDIRDGRLIGAVVLITMGAGLVSCRGGGADLDPRAQVRRRGMSIGGIWLMGVGTWILVSQLQLFGLDFHTSWPLLVVLGGVIIVIRGLK